ncbi:Pimeloyl-ACP methyl ester carboxylesterase [Paenibacillus sp. UNCCL117]|uniref:alpha/beta fold hydrolase n=1 Tax=unclassified Paenibacillus TaxID=185978 RepID=UPI00087E63DF|nr:MULTISPECIES: alpha/beta hydrolase [unclassified Paenibacillus]SDD17598.1 Pimeloyl-ACP methyl ester carboxylesterase [Paenibacillus sp. cl123]SFW35011.1 Pimeloyl-ACP methyl ester carboxylesterase [Paenibacillus sp. UNCCL117]
MNERLLTIDGIELCADSFGKQGNPAILLIMGAQSSMIWWEEEFCRRLADEGRFVIRYDNRDVGRSTSYEPGQPDYHFEDMTDDAVRVLDAYQIDRAHIAGMSMGGMLTQMIALRHPERVLTITLLATSNFAPHLPPMEEKVMDFFSKMGAVDWTSEQAVVQYAVDRSRVLVGSKHSFDEAKVAGLAKQEFTRSARMASVTNHALLSGGESYLSRTSEINVPALIIHGTEDPIIPYEHGKHLADEIPNSALLTLEGAGHELHEDDWDVVIEAVSKHTSASN